MTRTTSQSPSALRLLPCSANHLVAACSDRTHHRYKALVQKNSDLDAAIVKAKSQVAFVA